MTIHQRLREPAARRKLFVACGLILIGLSLLWRSLRYGLAFPIWGDEAFVAVNFLVRDYQEMIAPLEWGQIVPLLFMWAELAISKSLGYSEHALRLLPFLAGVVSLLLFAGFGRAVLDRRTALIALAIFAASYYPIRHAAEVKPYSTDLLVGLGLILLGWATHRFPGRFWLWALLVTLGGLSPWMSYPAIFSCGAVGLLHAVALASRLIGGKPSSDGLTPTRIADAFGARLVGTLLFSAVTLASFVWMYSVYGRPHAQAAAAVAEINMWRVTFPPLAEPWKLPIWFWVIHTGNLMAYPIGGRGASVGTFALVVIGAVALIRRGQGPLVLLLLSPLLFNFAASALRAYPYGGSARTSLFMAPAFCLLAGAGLMQVFRWALRGRRRDAAVLIAVGVCAVIAVVGMIRDVRKQAKDVAVRASYEAVRWLEENSSSDDQWIVFNAVEPVPYAPWLGDWSGTGGQWVFDMLRFAPGGIQQVRFAPPPDSVEPASGVTWLIAYRGVKTDFPEAQFDAYRDSIERRLGPPATAVDAADLSDLPDCAVKPQPGDNAVRFLLKERDVELPDGTTVPRQERIDIYRYPPR